MEIVPFIRSSLARLKTPYQSKTAIGEQRLVYQFKITLLDVKPPVWRRIQVPDGTLNELHNHIQTAMGWTNSHLHQFEIGDRCYGDPQLLDDGWGENEVVDSTAILLSSLLGNWRRGFCFYYEYDFSDGWMHEIGYERVQPAPPRQRYPRCVGGARACPPEDVGGPEGFADFAHAMKDAQAPQYRELCDWLSGRFDAEAFSATEATKVMRTRLPHWRDYR